MKKILLIDGYNLFARNFCINPAISENGEPFGGVFGFIQSLQKYCKQMHPDEIHIAWDGGSEQRKEENSNYKANREEIQSLRLNRTSNNLSQEDVTKNRHWQWARLVENYLNNMPIRQYWLNSVEADDIIAYLAKHNRFKNDLVIVISSDNDYIQLVTDKVLWYCPNKKTFFNEKKIVEKFNIHPKNFALCRAIAGDNSDNLKGVPRVGLKTLAKRFNFLSESKKLTLDNIKDSCIEQIKDSKIKIFNDILENTDLIQDNYKLMQLADTRLVNEQQKYVNNILENFVPSFNLTNFKLIANSDGIDLDKWKIIIAHMRGVVQKG